MSLSSSIGVLGEPVHNRLRRGAWILAFFLIAPVGPLRAQGSADADGDDRRADDPRLTLPWVDILWPEAPDSAPGVDVEERFAAFQCDFAREFGAESDDDLEQRATDVAERFKRRLLERFEGSDLFRWYQEALALYERFEGIYGRLEASTRWAAKGFTVDADVESVLDGTMRLHVERRIRGFHVGFDVNDARKGRLGLRVGGVVRGYSINLDVSDIAAGELRLGLKKRLE